MRKRIATVLFVSAVVLGGTAAPAAADEVGGCPNSASGWTLMGGQILSAHDANGDGHICIKDVKGNGNHGEGVSHKDN